MSLGGGDLGHAGLGGSLGAGLGHAGLGVGTGEGTGRGAMSQSLGGGHGTSGLGASRAPIGLGLTKGIGTPGSDDLPLGVSSRELGLGNNFGLDASDNVLSRAARVGTSPAEASDGSETKAARNEGAQAGRSEAIDSEEQSYCSSSSRPKWQANLPPTPSPSTTAVPQPAAPTLPEVPPVVTTSLGSGEVQMIGAYFAQHGAPVASIPTSGLNVSVGGTVPKRGVVSAALRPCQPNLRSPTSLTSCGAITS